MSNRPKCNFVWVQKFFQRDFKQINQKLPCVLHGHDIHQNCIK